MGDETTTTTTETPPDGDNGNMIPKSRLDEVIAQRNTYEQKLSELQKQYEESLATFKTQIDELSPFKERATQAEQAAAEAALRAMRLEVAAEMALPLALAERLKGDDREAIMADAEKIKALIPAPSPALGNPPPGPRTGPAPAVTQAQLSDPDWVRKNKDKVRAHYANGQ